MSTRALCPILLFSGLISPLFAIDYHFNVADGDWYTASNWNPASVPQGGPGNHAYIDAGKTVTISQDTDGGGSGFDIQDTFVGRGSGNVGTVNQTAGTFNADNGWLFVGDSGGTGTWNMSGNSSVSTGRFYIGGVRGQSPASGNGSLNINTTGTITLTSDFSVGTNGATGNVVMTAGTLNANSWAIIGETESGNGGSVGTMIQNGGTVNFGATDAGGRFWLGSQEGTGGAGSNGSYTLNAGTLTSRNIVVGHGATGFGGTFTQTGGSFTVLGGNDDNRIADGPGSTGTWNMSGGTATILNHWQVGGSGSGIFNMTGGTMDHTGAYPVIARFAGSTGVANISGGTFNQNGTGQRLIIGEEGTGTLNVSGTAVVKTDGGMPLGLLATGNGTLNLNSGGTVSAPWIGQGLGVAKINFNGGTFKLNAGSPEIFPVVDTTVGPVQPTAAPIAATSLSLLAGGGKIDTNGLDAGTGVSFSGEGSLSKLGAGILSLSGISTHTGGTFVTAGTVKLTATGALSGTGQIDVAAGATLDASASSLSLLTGQSLTGKGTVAGNVLVGSGTLAPGNSIGTLTFANNLTLSPTSVSNFEISKSPLVSADLANVLGSLTLGGTLNVTSLGGTFASGDTFNLFDAASISGSFASVNLPATSGGAFWVNNLGTTGTITFVPEPGSSLLFGIAGLGLLASRRRRDRTAA